MKRSMQEIVELIIFGLLAVLIGTGVLWLLGALFGVLGIVFKFIAGLLWLLLSYILPVAIVGGVVFFGMRFFANRGKNDKAVPVEIESITEIKFDATASEATDSDATDSDATDSDAKTPLNHHEIKAGDDVVSVKETLEPEPIESDIAKPKNTQTETDVSTNSADDLKSN